MSKRRRKREEGELRLTDKRHPALAIVAVITGLISLGVFAAACIVSGEHGGKADMTVGMIGLLCLALSLIGFVMAWLSLHKENIRPLFPTIGSVLNGLLVIGYMLLYIWGATA